MDTNPKNKEKLEIEDLEVKVTTDKEEKKSIEDLREVMKKIEEMSKKQSHKRPRRRMISLEFGGVFHQNRIINFTFTYILTFTIAFFITELFSFVTYRDIIYFAGIILVFNIFEEIVKSYLLNRHFRIILRTFGTVFYFIYLLLFYMLDQYVFVRSFNFINEIVLVFFVLFLAVLRYIFGQLIRKYLRYRSLG